MLVAGCATTGSGTAPVVDCRGREAIPITEWQADHEEPAILAPKVAHNENLERECGVKAPNPSGQAKAKAAVKKARR
ncbi:hypothetical protein [Xanthobacter sp.]|uniref:hypothetical protein n=1 Tax=Xanthobacter sp. TaxID=35809 RepID=UPI0025D3BC49|nr:hypothetical protein [Xanthobacter sp.]